MITSERFKQSHMDAIDEEVNSIKDPELKEWARDNVLTPPE